MHFDKEKVAEIERLLKAGTPYHDIRKYMKVSLGALSYRAAKLGLSKEQATYDWKAVAEKVLQGWSCAACVGHFGMSRGAFYKAITKGWITSPDKKPKHTAEIFAATINGKHGGHGMIGWSRRNKMKRLLVEEGMPYECRECRIKNWQGKPLILRLDHIDGDNTNWGKKNLRLLCPNCDSQQDTYCYKNSKRKKT